MKKLIVIGLGVVGGLGTLTGFRQLGFNNFYGWDIDENKRNKFPKEWILNPKEAKDGIFIICTREESVVEVIEEYKNYTKNFIIRSTINPELFDLPEKYPELNILHNPEFLTEQKPLKDFLNPNRIILGGSCPELKIYIKNLYKEAFPLTKIISDLTFKESALIKLFNNSYLSTLISFWNEAGKICNKANVNAERVAAVCATDSRISEYGTIGGAKFGGYCLPKDLNHLLSGFNGLILLKAVKDVNEKI